MLVSSTSTKEASEINAAKETEGKMKCTSELELFLDTTGDHPSGTWHYADVSDRDYRCVIATFLCGHEVFFGGMKVKKGFGYVGDFTLTDRFLQCPLCDVKIGSIIFRQKLNDRQIGSQFLEFAGSL